MSSPYKNIKSQVKNRATLRRRRQKTSDTNEKQRLCDEILQITDKINYLKSELKYCEKIEEQSEKIKENLKEMQVAEKNDDKTRKKGEMEK